MSDIDTEILDEVNDHLVLICGESGAGKSASLRNIQNQDRWMYLNCEAGKRLPFRNKFQSFKITDPYQVWEAFDHGIDNAEIDGVIIDTATFLLDMFETLYIARSTNSQQGWQDFQQFWKVLMNNRVVRFNKPTVILAHTKSEYDEGQLMMKTSVPVKGALKNQGLEAYFSTVVATLKMEIKHLKPYENALLNITPEEEALGYKHVFQTRPTKGTVGGRVRTPMEMFEVKETYIDNDVNLLMDRLKKFYA